MSAVAFKIPSEPGWGALVWRTNVEGRQQIEYESVAFWTIDPPRIEPRSFAAAILMGSIGGEVKAEYGNIGSLSGDTGARPIWPCDGKGEPMRTIFRLLPPGHSAEEAMAEAGAWVAGYVTEAKRAAQARAGREP